MHIDSDGEIILEMSHKTDNYLCFVGNRHGKSFKIYLSGYDLIRPSLTGLYGNSSLRAIIHVDDNVNAVPISKKNDPRIERTTERQIEAEKMKQEFYTFRNTQLELLTDIRNELKGMQLTKKRVAK